MALLLSGKWAGLGFHSMVWNVSTSHTNLEKFGGKHSYSIVPNMTNKKKIQNFISKKNNYKIWHRLTYLYLSTKVV